MKFLTLVDNFHGALALAERATGKSPHLPILGHFLIESDKNRVQVSATNLELGVVTSFSAKIESPGKVTVPARTLLNFLSQVGDEKVEVTGGEKVLTVSSSRHKANFQGLASEEFPLIPSVNDSSPIVFLGKALGAGLSQVLSSASTSDIRPELASVLLSYEPAESLKLVATDSARLAEKTILPSQFQTERKGKTSILIPLRTAQEVARISQEKNGDVRVFSDQAQIEFRWEDTRLVSRILEGEFPNYTSVVPTEFVAEGVFPRKKLLEAIRVSGVFATKLNDVKVTADPETKSFSFRAQEVSLGENETKVEGFEVRGRPHEVSFNWRYLIDGLENIEEENAVLRLGESIAPSLIKPEKDSTYFYIVMPIKT
jgi:DNA polymerase-3 subunit beta